MRTIMVSRRMLGWLGLLATVAVAGCTATSTSSPVAPDRSASPAAAIAVSPRATSSSAPAGPGSARHLAVSQDVRNELTAAYADYRGYSPADLAFPGPGRVYYAYDPATYTYWAQVNFLPSSTASAKVLVGLQDGASFGLFTRIGNGSWQVQLGGEPVGCAEVQFFPQAVLTAWSLRPFTAGFSCRSQPPRPAPTRPVTSRTYAVSISLPASWHQTPYLGPDGFGYDGTSGWVELTAAADPAGLHTACTDTATGNVQHLYGLHPLIIYRSVNGRPGCLIFPSGDAPALARRAGGPAFQNSLALIEYRQSIPIGGSCASPTGPPTGKPCRYSMLEISADPAHLVAIVDSVQLHH